MNILSGMLGLLMFFATAIWPTNSIFNLDLNWTNDLGQEVKLERFNSKPTLLTMVYTHCATACPVTVSRLVKVNELAKQQNIPLHIALVSVDVTRDTTKRLHAFRKEQKLSEDDWSLLNGQETDVRALSVAIGFNYKKAEGSSEIIHSNTLVLLNEAGEIKHTFEGLNQTPEEILAEVKALIKK